MFVLHNIQNSPFVQSIVKEQKRLAQKMLNDNDFTLWEDNIWAINYNQLSEDPARLAQAQLTELPPPPVKDPVHSTDNHLSVRNIL